jgi:hypothetical protein
METHFLLTFGEEEVLAPLAITVSEAFFNKLLMQLFSDTRFGIARGWDSNSKRLKSREMASCAHI